MDRARDRIYIIGPGEVGRRLGRALGAAGFETVEVTRSRGWEEAGRDPAGIRLVCVREEALEGVLSRLRAVDGDRIVTVQNGWIRPLLAELPGSTRGLIWFTSKGDFFRVLRPSPFSGPLADSLAAGLEAGGISATSVDARDFAALEADKMGFNCVVGLPLAVHRLTLGEYLQRHADEARAVFEESVTVCARALSVEANPDWWPAFLASAEPLGWVGTRVAKALEFRNGAVAELARRLEHPVPVTEGLLSEAPR
jgi:ketopantoate reductase